MAPRTRDEVQARIRAAIGEPRPAARGLDLEALAQARGSRRLTGPGNLPSPLRLPSLAALLVTVVAAVGAGALFGVRPAAVPAARAPASRPLIPPPGPAVAAFVPADVTAISTGEWWVAGRDASGCSGAGCSRILWTKDDGLHFSSIATPPITVDHLRFANSHDGWAYDGSAATVWVTHDGGARWSKSSLPGPVAGLETSGGFVYAIVCPASSAGCLLERSSASDTRWSALPLPAGSGRLSDVNVHGPDVWVVTDRGASTPTEVLRSSNDGARFASSMACGGGGASVASLDAVDPDVVWAICVTSAGGRAWAALSMSGGRIFTPVDALGSVHGLSIAATSAHRAVVAGTDLELSSDGGASFHSVLDTGARWSLVGFTTATAGFAIADPRSVDASLWRTEDGGVNWGQVILP